MKKQIRNKRTSRRIAVVTLGLLGGVASAHAGNRSDFARSSFESRLQSFVTGAKADNQADSQDCAEYSTRLGKVQGQGTDPRRPKINLSSTLDLLTAFENYPGEPESLKEGVRLARDPAWSQPATSDTDFSSFATTYIDLKGCQIVRALDAVRTLIATEDQDFLNENDRERIEHAITEFVLREADEPTSLIGQFVAVEVLEAFMKDRPEIFTTEMKEALQSYKGELLALKRALSPGYAWKGWKKGEPVPVVGARNLVRQLAAVSRIAAKYRHSLWGPLSHLDE
jgi:hypothetical protein